MFRFFVVHEYVNKMKALHFGYLHDQNSDNIETLIVEFHFLNDKRKSNLKTKQGNTN